MLCPFCKCESSKVLESRTTSEKSSIRRRRECEKCGRRFTTYERVELMPVTVLKRNGSREDYSTDKLLNSINRACHKSAMSRDQIEGIVEAIESELANLGKREINSTVLGKLILDHLKEQEPAVYIRYSSVYNNFTSASDFIEEANTLIQAKTAIVHD